MKDPRALLYEQLEANPENATLIADTKAYMESIIGQSATAKTQATDAIAAAQLKFDTDLAAAKAVVPVANGDTVSRAEFDAMKSDYKTSQGIIEKQNLETKSQALTTALNGRFTNIDEDFRNALVGAMKSGEGYTMGGKTYKAAYDGESILMTVDGESASLDSGVESIMSAGLSAKVAGAAGGGFPAFDNKGGNTNPTLGFDADINADLKS